MANFNFNEYEASHQKPASQSTYNNGDSKPFIETIKIKDGDEAIVRFYVSTSDDIEVTTVHSVDLLSRKNTTYSKSVSCLRESGQDTLDICPLCAKGNPIKTRAYIKLLEYTNQNGEIVATPKLWDTSLTMARILNSFLADYGDLTEYIFKLKRTGTGTSTRYNLVPVPTTSPIYRPEIYKKEFEKFEDYVVSPYWKKSFDDMQAYVATGAFPKKVVEKESQDNQTTSNVIEEPRQEVVRPTSQPVQEQPQVQRPKRFTY